MNSPETQSRHSVQRLVRAFNDRIAIQRFKAALNMAMWGEQNPKCIFPQRPDWWQRFLMWAHLPWCMIHTGDAIFKVWYAVVNAFWDTCVWIQIKRGKIKP